MSIAIINGSPKSGNSNSRYIIKDVVKMIGYQDILTFEFSKPELKIEYIEKIAACRILIFVFPLYVDGIPSHLVNCFKQLEDVFKESQVLRHVYVVIQCGFYEGRQNAIALDMMKNWCAKAKATWGQGIGIGGSGMMSVYESIPENRRIKRTYLGVIRQFSESILALQTGKNIFVSPAIPRIIYLLGAHIGWRRQIRRHGLTVKNLHTQK